MTPQDRELFRALTLRQTQLEEALAHLRKDLQDLERRAESVPVPAPAIPPIPRFPAGLPPVPTLPARLEEHAVPEIQEPPALPVYLVPIAPETSELAAPEIPPNPEATAASNEASLEVAMPLPPLPEFRSAPPPENFEKEEPSGGLEFQFGRWLARIGVVFALITLISFSTLAYKSFYKYMCPWSKLAILAVVSSGLVATGLRIERKNPQLTVYGRTLAGGGLACLYYTLYGATYVEPLKVIGSPLLGGILLLAWSAYVLYLAETKKSELLSIFAIALAYFSSAITPVGEFTMVANLILSATAVVFLIRNAWTGLSYLCLVGTYVGLLRQFITYDSASEDWFEIAPGIAFLPAATYLAGAWIIYTAGIFLAATPNFAAGKRMAFLCLNNGALIGLLTLASSLSGFGHIGPILCLVGGLFLATSYLATRAREEVRDVSEAYLIQGLALATGGIVMAYAGVTRGLLVTVESVFLAAAGAYARNPVFRLAGYVGAFLGAAFLLGEIIPGAAHPWVLTLGGSLAMLVNAWLARRELWPATREVAAETFVPSSAYYVLLALALLIAGFHAELSETRLAPALALTALALTFSIYLVPLFELPLLSQILLVVALARATFPLDDSHAWWSELLVGSATMVLVAWWPRQKLVRTGVWLAPMLVLYALAMVAVTGCAVHPHVDDQGWMIATSLLSLAFLGYGISARTWAFAVAGQLLLAISIYHFAGDILDDLHWAWWAATIPIAVTFFTAWLVQERLRKTDESKMDGPIRGLLDFAVCAYQCLTVGLIVRYVFGLVPEVDIPLTFSALGTVLMLWNLKWPSALGIRCGMVLDLFGTLAYLVQVTDDTGSGATWQNGLGLLALLAQPVVLRRWGTGLVSRWEIYTITFLANLCTSIYVYWALHPHLTAEAWMIVASLLSLVFLAYGTWARMPQFILSGQGYLALAIWTFFDPPIGLGSFAWSWWAAAVPPGVVFLTGWLAHRWLPRLLGVSERLQGWLSAAAYCYQALALGLVVRWIFGIVSADETTLAFFMFATGLLIWNLRWPSAFGLRAGLLIDLVGAGNDLASPLFPDPHAFTWAHALAFSLFLAQPAILRHWGREILSAAESWTLILLSSAMAWLFVSDAIVADGSHNLTLGWALFALALTLIGFAVNERRQRWCGLGILLSAILRVGVYDFWGFSDLYKVLTFFALTVICLGLSFLYYKFADRLKEWL